MAKIVHLTSVHPAFDTRIFSKECETLSSAGHDVVLVAPHSKGEIVNGVRIVPVPKAHTRLGRILVTTVRVLRAALREDANVFHIHDPELLWAAAYMRMRGRVVVYDMHENVPKQIATKHWLPGWIRGTLAKAARASERLILPRLHVILAEHSYSEDYAWLPSVKTILNLPRLNIRRIADEHKHDVKTIVYIGRIHSDRGADLIVNALVTLKNQGKVVRCDFVGDGAPEYIASLKQLVQKRRLDVTFHGYLPREAGLRVVAKAHVGIAVLMPVPNYVQSYPTKLFEYMALGIPVITSNFPLYKDVVERNDCGICVDPLSESAIVDAIDTLLSKNDAALRMGRNGVAAVCREYQWEREAEKLLHFYETSVLAS